MNIPRHYADKNIKLMHFCIFDIHSTIGSVTGVS